MLLIAKKFFCKFGISFFRNHCPDLRCVDKKIVKKNIINFSQHCGVNLGRECTKQEVDGVTDKLTVLRELGNHHRDSLVVPEFRRNIKTTVEHIGNRLRSVKNGDNINYGINLVGIGKLVTERCEHCTAETYRKEINFLGSRLLKYHIYVPVKPLSR